MKTSLRMRLLRATFWVVVIAVGVTAVFAAWTTNAAFQSYVRHDRAARTQYFAVVLPALYRQAQDWATLQPMLEQMARSADVRLIVTDPAGRVVADSARALVGREADARWTEPTALLVNGAPIGKLYQNPVEGGSPAIADFFETVNRTVLFGAGIAGIVALVVMLGLARRITQPIESLTAAARQMEKGDRAARVVVQSDDELGQLARAFNAMANSVARQEQLQRNMVNDVAHELRTPLTNLRGYLEAARDGMVALDAGLVEDLHAQALSLNRLVDDLQELALAEAGQLRFEIQSVQIGDLVRATETAFRPSAESRGLRLVIELPSDVPLVRADPHRVQQVLRNLLNNALDFTPRDGQITLTVRREEACVWMRVRDTGVGIAVEHLPFVFERFYRADKSRARATGGMGLGLAIVNQLVEAQGGRVEVTSAPGEGAEFSFALPLAEN